MVDVLTDPQHPHTRQLLADAELGTVDGPGSA